MLQRIKLYHLRKKFIKNYKQKLKKNKIVEGFSLDCIFNVNMHFPMFEICDVLNNIGVNRLINKLYKLKKNKDYNVKIYYRNSKLKKMDYIQPQYNHNEWGILAKVKLLKDSLIEDIEIDWTQINNEEAMIIYEIKFKKWINELKDMNEYVLQNINDLIYFEPTLIYDKDFFDKERNEQEIYNIVCEMFYAVMQKKLSKLFYTELGKQYLLPLLNKYVIEEKNETVESYLKESFLNATYIKSKNENKDTNVYIIDSFDEYKKRYDEFIFGKSYSPGSTLLYYFSEYRMEFYYQVFENIEINILEKKMSKYLNSHRRNIKISDYKWLIKKVRQLGEKRLYDIVENVNDKNLYGCSKREKGKKFINLNTYSKRFETVYQDNLNYIKEMNNVDYNYKIYIITIITLALTIIGTISTLKDINKENSNDTKINNEINLIESKGNEMIDNNYLSYEDQFKEILNQEEINRIENYEMREIRMKYWNLRHQAFLDEVNIKDCELGKVLDELWIEEQKELEKFKVK